MDETAQKSAAIWTTEKIRAEDDLKGVWCSDVLWYVDVVEIRRADCDEEEEAEKGKEEEEEVENREENWIGKECWP